MGNFIKILQKDIENNFSILFANNPIPENELDDYLKKIDVKFPPDLIMFWLKYGGGDLYETETILSPNHSEKTENIFYFNEFDNPNKDLFIFHTGLFDTGIDKDGKIWIVDSLGQRKLVKNMAEWYGVLRKEYTFRYI